MTRFHPFAAHARRRFTLSSAFLLGASLLSGCGNPGSPLPPSLMLPQPVADLSAARTGDTITLHWTMPRHSVDRLVLKGDQRAVLCRALATGPCETQAVLLLAAGNPAGYTDALPSQLGDGGPKLLRYEVRLQNHRKQDAGASNPAFAVAGSAPPPVQSASAMATAQGIALQWKAPSSTAIPPLEAQLLVRIERDRVLQAGETGKPDGPGVPQPMQQILEAAEHPPAIGGASEWTPNHTLDAQVAMNRSYRYTVQLVEQITLDGHTLTLSGIPAQAGVIEAKDVFPPEVPTDVVAVANTDGGAIDLSWAAGADGDVAGYFVYRRAAADGRTPPERVSGNKPVPTPNWSDTTARKGMRYAYSVSAVDTSGNESARSSEVAEALPE